MLILAGRVWRAVCWTRATASPRDTPGARLKEIVTEGSCPEWLMVSGPVPGVTAARLASGTSVPEGALIDSSCSAERSR